MTQLRLTFTFIIFWVIFLKLFKSRLDILHHFVILFLLTWGSFFVVWFWWTGIGVIIGVLIDFLFGNFYLYPRIINGWILIADFHQVSLNIILTILFIFHLYTHSLFGMEVFIGVLMDFLFRIFFWRVLGLWRSYFYLYPRIINWWILITQFQPILIISITILFFFHLYTHTLAHHTQLLTLLLLASHSIKLAKLRVKFNSMIKLFFIN